MGTSLQVIRALFASVSVLALAIGCSSSVTGNGTSSGGDGTSSSGGAQTKRVSSADCSERCQARATQCEATPAQAEEACSTICSSATEDQLDCLAAKSCAELGSASSFQDLCPGGSSSSSSSSSSSGSSGNTSGKKLGESCICPDKSEESEGLCAGTDNDCSAGLSCIYEVRSEGKGFCFGPRCCAKTAECDEDPSLREDCSVGTCQRTPVGFFCGK